MRYIIYGAGAVGGLTGALMAEAGQDVLLIARGAHYEAIAADGLTIESSRGSRSVPVPVVAEPAAAGVEEGDVVLLAMKSQDTAAAADTLRRCAAMSTAVVCLQNGVENERVALRLFRRVYGVCIMCPAAHLEPGVVQQSSVPLPGLLDIGRYPTGTDDTTAQTSRAFRAAGFESLERTEVMRWKYRKLLLNLGNAVQALIGPPGLGRLTKLAREEGERCLVAAGTDFASAEEDAERRGDRLTVQDIDGRPRGNSSWQSLQRGAGSIETDYLNGEISLLGRLHGVPTPVNDLLQRLAFEAAVRGDRPGQLSAEAFEAQLQG